MIDSENLRTASLYINNQLLCRGLLRDGRTIDFADPGFNEHDLADTMGRIMGVVNDLILRRDRDAEHREALSTTLRSVRADSLRQTDNLSRLHDRYADAERKVALHEAEEAALRSQLKAAEATIQKLKEEAARAKKLVAETRAACANEVRKRDRQIEGLKKAVTDAGRARGERKGNTMTTIQVAGEIGAEDMTAGASTMDESYNLRHETNGFLAQLAKGLNEENESLLSLIRKTGDSLKEMSGWDKQDADGKKGNSQAVVLATTPDDMAADMTSVLEHLRTLLTNPSFVPLEEVVVREEEIFRLRDGWEKMETRWRDAVHLIDGWRRRMAAGGHPVDMEDLKMGLRLSPVRIQNLEQTNENDPFQLSTLQEEEEVEHGQGDEDDDDDDDEEQEEYAQEEEQMDFKQAEPPSLEGSLHLVPAPGYEDMVPEYEEGQDDVDDSDAASSIFQDDVEDIDMDELQASEPNIEILHHSTGLPDDTNSMTLPPPPKITPLEETVIAGNRKPSARLTEKSRKRSSELMRDTSNDSAKAPPPPPPPHRVKEGESPQKRLKVSADGQNDKPRSRPNSANFTDPGSSLGSELEAKATPESSVSKTSSKTTVKSTRSDLSAKKDTPTQRKPSTKATRAAKAQEKKDTPTRAITPAKLAASEREADAARVRAKLRAARLNKGGSGSSANSLAPSTAGASTSTVASSRVPSGVGAGDPTKKDRAVSGESAATGMSGSGASFSTDENGLRGGVSVLGGGDGDNSNSNEDSNEDEDEDDRRTVVPSSSRKDGAAPPSPRKTAPATSPTKASAASAAAASPAKPAARKREVRSRAAKAANRRRSTLSPWELQSLIAGEVVPPTPEARGVVSQQAEGE
ncbi:putative nima interactive protein [Diaporthe ampelina]|uniref:Putative nima interactive protein n=1 Tax=Diaporthe ampelina TaxID=1214573 RepID=A0A0G2HV49_9PEZI|nr:putative nima interactive protein [Diaporthe ampelina]